MWPRKHASFLQYSPNLHLNILSYNLHCVPLLLKYSQYIFVGGASVFISQRTNKWTFGGSNRFFDHWRKKKNN